jgi:hypothetical protein
MTLLTSLAIRVVRGQGRLRGTFLHEVAGRTSECSGALRRCASAILPARVSFLIAGRTLFEGVNGRPPRKRTLSRNFANGNVYVCYQPA